MLLHIAVFVGYANGAATLSQALVVGFDIADFFFCQQLVAALHFVYRPFQRADGLFGVIDNRSQQVRNILVRRHFYLLGVHQNQLHITGAIAIE